MTEHKAKGPAQDDIIDIEPQVISETKTDAARPRRLGLMRVAALASAALLCAAAGGWFYRDVLARYLPSDEVQKLSQRIDALEGDDKETTKRIDAIIALTDELKAQVGAAQAAAESASKSSTSLLAQSEGNAQALDALKSKLQQAQAGLDEVKTQLTQGVSGLANATDPLLAQRLDALEKSLATQQSAAPAGQKPDMSALQRALDGLSGKVADGSAFGSELQLVAQQVPAAEGLDVLKAAAETGAPNANQLIAALQKASAGVPQANAAQASDGWLDRLENLFSSIVTVKPLEGADWATVAAKASALLTAGDMQQADSLFDSAASPPPAAMAEWRELLQRRIKLDDAMAKVKAAVAREIAAKG